MYMHSFTSSPLSLSASPLSLPPRINFAQRHPHTEQVDANGDTYEFEFFDPKWTRSADKITFLPATRRREEERRKNHKAKEPSLVWALVRTFWRTFVFAGMLKLFQDLLNFVSPQLLKYVTSIGGEGLTDTRKILPCSTFSINFAPMTPCFLHPRQGSSNL